MVNFGKLLHAWARIDAAVEGVVGGFDDASGLAVALVRDQICDSYSLASSADLNFYLEILQDKFLKLKKYYFLREEFFDFSFASVCSASLIPAG